MIVVLVVLFLFALLLVVFRVSALKVDVNDRGCVLRWVAGVDEIVDEWNVLQVVVCGCVW